MTALVERRAVLTEIPAAHDDERSKFFAESIAALNKDLDEYGTTDDSLGGIQILSVKIDENIYAQGEYFEYSKGTDAPNFFQIDSGEPVKKTDSKVVFYDEKGHSITPDLCVRIETSGDKSLTFNCIISGDNVFEVATQQKDSSTQELPVKRRASQVIYQTANGLSHTDNGEWVKNLSSVAVRRIPEAHEIGFMQRLTTLTSNATKRERDSREQDAAPRSNRPA